MRKNPLGEGKRWLLQAQENLRWAKELTRLGGYHIACFLAQQIAEKALTGYLYAQGEEIVVGHSVARLCEVAASYDRGFLEKKPAWAILDGYYVPIRYPNALPDGAPAHTYNETVAHEAAQVAEEVLAFIEKKLNAADRGEGSHSPTGSS